MLPTCVLELNVRYAPASISQTVSKPGRRLLTRMLAGKVPDGASDGRIKFIVRFCPSLFVNVPVYTVVLIFEFEFDIIPPRIVVVLFVHSFNTLPSIF